VGGEADQVGEEHGDEAPLGGRFDSEIREGGVAEPAGCSPSVAPNWLRNRIAGSFAAPHASQTSLSATPQAPQKRELAGSPSRSGVRPSNPGQPYSSVSD
jgi:hypothetical protein